MCGSLPTRWPIRNGTRSIVTIRRPRTSVTFRHAWDIGQELAVTIKGASCRNPRRAHHTPCRLTGATSTTPRGCRRRPMPPIPSAHCTLQLCPGSRGRLPRSRTSARRPETPRNVSGSDASVQLADARGHSLHCHIGNRSTRCRQSAFRSVCSSSSTPVSGTRHWVPRGRVKPMTSCLAGARSPTNLERHTGEVNQQTLQLTLIRGERHSVFASSECGN